MKTSNQKNSNTTINSSIRLILSVNVIALLVVGFISFMGLSKIQNELTQVNSKLVNFIYSSSQIEMNINRINTLYEAFISLDGKGSNKLLPLLQKKVIEFKKSLEDITTEFSDEKWLKIRIGEIQDQAAKVDQAGKNIVLAYLDDKTSEIKADEKQLVIHLKELSTMQKTLNERYQKIAENKIIEIMTNIKVYLIISILFFLIISLVISLIIARQIHNKIFSIATGIENLAITNLSSIRAIQGAFDQLEATFSSQISEVHNSASAVEEITTTIEKNITSVNVSSQFAIASQKKTSEGRSNISQLIELSNQIDGDLENFKETIQQGNSETRKIITLLSQISKKTILIDEIVFQTKLLAFNASVEAARAGEHGKGFSVVAEEIGKLAHSSGEIAKDITEIVSKSVIDTEQIILETTKNISGLVDHTKQTTAKGKVQANISGQTLAEISENTLKVSEMLSSFALGSGEQSIGINSISKSIYKVDELSQKSLIQIQNTAGSIHSLQSSGKELEESSQNLLLILRKKEVS